MRKLFLFIGAVLLSVAMQAEIVFSGDAHNTGSWNAKQMPVADFPVLAKASAGDLIVITVSEAETGGRICLQNMAWAGLGYDEYNVVAGVYPFVLTAEAAAEVNTNGLIVTGEKYSFNKVELLYQRTLWTGSVDATGNWQQSDALNNDLFAFLKEGDFLGVTVSEIHEGEWHQYSIRENYATNIIEHSMNAAKTGVDRLTASVVASLKSNTIILVSSYLHATAIHTYVAEKGLTPLWSGSQVIGEWSNELDNIPASRLSDLQVGNILCVRVSAIGTEASPRVTLAYGDSWNNFSPVVEYYFQGGDEAPMVVEFPVTHKLEKQLRGNKLVVRGVNYTVTDVYYIPGTPSNTKAAYLNVSAAGMATYVLPFDVQDLPDGVEAYNLTNDGSDVIEATAVSALQADKPVLILAAEGEYEFISKEGASDDISGKTDTYANGALVGTYHAIAAVPQTEGGNYNYVLQKHGEEVGFYQVKSDDCALNPYRAYLSCSRPHTSGAQAAPMRIVFHTNTTTGVETVQGDKVQSAKVLRNGQLFILRNGVEYNVNGQIVK